MLLTSVELSCKKSWKKVEKFEKSFKIGETVKKKLEKVKKMRKVEKILKVENSSEKLKKGKWSEKNWKRLK